MVLVEGGGGDGDVVVGGADGVCATGGDGAGNGGGGEDAGVDGMMVVRALVSPFLCVAYSGKFYFVDLRTGIFFAFIRCGVAVYICLAAGQTVLYCVYVSIIIRIRIRTLLARQRRRRRRKTRRWRRRRRRVFGCVACEPSGLCTNILSGVYAHCCVHVFVCTCKCIFTCVCVWVCVHIRSSL